MASVTIRNLADSEIAAVKKAAKSNGRSMEQELREAIRERYIRAAKLERLLQRLEKQHGPEIDASPEELERMINEGRA